MFNYSIGLRGLQIAQRAIELIGTNMANASSEGYHRQDLQVPAVDVNQNGLILASTASNTGTPRRVVDQLLEQQYARQYPLLGQVNAELTTLRSVQSALGNVGEGGMTTALDDYFAALAELSSQPDSEPLQQQLIGSAQNVVDQFHTLSAYLSDLQENIRLQASRVTEQVNSLADEVSRLNTQILILNNTGGDSNILQDRRDQAVVELSQLVDVRTTGRTSTDGTVSVSAWGTPLVVGGRSTSIEVDAVGEMLGVSVEGAHFYQTDISGGQLGGLLTLTNELLPGLREQLDSLARQVVTQMNTLHAQGVGPSGSFDELQGGTVSTLTLEEWPLPVSSGTFYVRMTDTASGQVTREAVTIDASTDTAATMAAKLDALSHVSATYVDGRINLSAQSGYTFDFLPGVLPGGSGGTHTGTAEAAFSGIYSGGEDQTYSGKIVGDGQVGVTPGLAMEVYDAGGTRVRTINIGQGYAPGDRLEIANGLYLTLSGGTVNDGETIDAEALASSDRTGFLAAAGLNTFFTGTDARTIDIRTALKNNPALLATGLSADGTDNSNVARMIERAAEDLDDLGGLSMAEYFRQMLTDVGQGIAMRDARRISLEQVEQQLTAQRDTLSGVDINEESAKLLMFERMFQAMSKFISTQDKATDMLMSIIR